jgi:hypothetical protein
MSEKYIWYDTVKEQRVGKIRKEPYTVDGKPGILPDNVVELLMLHTHDTIDLETQTYISQTITVDIPNKTYTIHRNAGPKPPQPVPYSTTPSFLRMAMLDAGIDLNSITSLIDATVDPIEREKIRAQWEYSLSIRRDHPLVISFGANLGLTESQIDDIFRNAEALDVN